MLLFTAAAIGWLLFAVLAASVAYEKGYSAIAWFFGSLLLSPAFALIALAFATNLRREELLKARHEEITALLRASLPDSALAVMAEVQEAKPQPKLSRLAQSYLAAG